VSRWSEWAKSAEEKLLCTLIADENQLVKKAADGWWWCMEKLIWIEALLIRLRMLLPMPMKGGLKIAADETGGMPMKGGLKTVADETGSVPMERRSMGIPS
jgi:hypothetical protein